jgi:hypothetical protein
VITHGETGLLFRTGDLDGLTSNTLAAAGDPDLRARIGRQACLRVRAHAIDAAADAYLDAIGSLVDERRGGG